MLIFGSIGLFVRYIDLASSQIALVRGFIARAVLLFAMSVLKKSLDFSAWRKNALFCSFPAVLSASSDFPVSGISLYNHRRRTLTYTLHRPSSCSYRRFSCMRASRGAN